MDYVRGSDLEKYAAGRKLAPREVALLAAKVARALAEAHRQGIVHQDVKPRNILVDEAGEPRLIDFGLAWLRQSHDPDPGSTTGGTPAYMAPEQARGEADQVGPASDVFVLGGVLYFLLTGKAPFEAPDVLSALGRARRCDVDRDALRQAGAPRALAAICLRALSARPGERFASADEMATELERFARLGRLPFRLAVGVVVAVLVACAAGLWWWLRQEPAVPGAQALVALHLRKERPAPEMTLKNGDMVELGCDLPRGSRALLVWLDTEGRLEECQPLEVVAGPQWDRLRYPAEGAVPIIGPPGTEFILVVANRAKKPAPKFAEVRTILEGRGWPKLEDGTRLLLSRAGVSMGSEGDERGHGEPTPTGISQVRSRLEAVREALLAKYDYFWGVALPHARSGR
jgi:hypothetical protein